MANNNRNHPRGPRYDAMLAIDAVPKGYTIDVRVFLAVIAMTMALAFTAGVMIGPTDPRLVTPILSFLKVQLPELYAVHEPAAMAKAIKTSSSNLNIEAAPARKVSEETIDVAQGGKNTSKKAKEVIISANGEIVAAVDGGDVIIKQPKRTPTDHVATLGYKIKEVHVNIDTPVLEGTGDDVPYERDITYNNVSRHEGRSGGREQPLLRDQSNPSGQHLLVDIRNIEAAFLNSESRLADAMQETVRAGGLTMLSYHCHSLHPAGVSCVGVLLESHISFHTWPEEGVITLDMFTTSEKPLLPLLPKIEELFGIPRIDPETGLEEKCVTLWSHELRGFRTEDDRKANHLDGQSDLANWVTSPLEVVYKKEIVGMQTEHQRIDIWDIIERDETPSYYDGIELGLEPDDPRWLSNDHASPTRLFFLNGALQVKNRERAIHCFTSFVFGSCKWFSTTVCFCTGY